MRNNQYRSFWSTEEVHILTNNFRCEYSDLQKLLPSRSKYAIRNKIVSLHLHKKTWEEPKLISVESFDLGWLIGIIEGEGSLFLHKCHKRNSVSLRPILTICNTEKELIDRVYQIIKMGKITQPKYYGNSVRKQIYRVEITKFEDLLKLFTLLKNSFVSEKKRKICDLMLEFLWLRYGKLRSVRTNSSICYDKREWEIYENTRRITGN